MGRSPFGPGGERDRAEPANPAVRARDFAPLAERWNGTAWSVERVSVGSAAAPDLFGVSCVSTNSCAAVGCNLNGDFCSGAVAYVWNGTGWRPELMPAGSQRLSSVSCTAPSACMAVGEGSKGTLAHSLSCRV